MLGGGGALGSTSWVACSALGGKGLEWLTEVRREEEGREVGEVEHFPDGI